MKRKQWNQKFVWWLVLSIGSVMPQNKAFADKALIIEGTTNSISEGPLRKVTTRAAEAYQQAGWTSFVVRTRERSDETAVINGIKAALRLHAANLGAIVVVSHGDYVTSTGEGTFVMKDAAGNNVEITARDLAAWWRAEKRRPLDEVLFHSCLIGKETGLKARFDNPAYFVSWDYEVEYFLLSYFERKLHKPKQSHKPPAAFSESVNTDFSDVDAPNMSVDSFTAENTCLGGQCANPSCLNLSPEAQASIDAAQTALSEGEAAIEGGDDATALSKLIEAQKFFIEARELGVGSPVPEYIALINEILAGMGIPALSSVSLIVFGGLLLGCGAIILKRRNKIYEPADPNWPALKRHHGGFLAECQWRKGDEAR